LTLLSIQSKRLSCCRLAFIMACNGAVGSEDSACDDSFSSGTSFLVADARHVICTLWPVGVVASALIGRRLYENLERMRGELPSAAPQSVSACLLEAQRWYRGLGYAAAQALELFPTREDLRLALLTQNKLRGDLAGDTETDEANWAGYICMGPVEVDERHPCP
jgi:CHAT domain-containing protein